jgi:hypothetical protein
MAEEEGKKEEEKFEFDSAGQAVAYISLDQARVLEVQHARDNREFYERYATAELVWEVVSAEETEDYYEIKLVYRPGREFRGRAGVEQFTIDKTGPIELRQILQEPRPSDKFLLGLVGAVAVLLVRATIGGLFAGGVLTTGPTPLITSVSIDRTPRRA